MVAEGPQIAHPEEREIWLAVAAVLTPRARERYSRWISQNIRLTAKQSPRPGYFDVNYKPFTAAVIDRHYDNPTKKGVIAPKPSQVGLSYLFVALMLCLMFAEPGPQLYVTDTREKAADYKHRLFDEWVENCDALKDDVGSGEDDRNLAHHAEYSGGSIDFAGAGTEAGVTSQARRFVFLDEFQEAARNFAEGSNGGDLWVAALGRFFAYKDSSGLFAFSHPRFPDEDIHAKFMELSDQGTWAFDCPHCQGVVFPCFDCIHFEGYVSGDDNTLDASKAVFRCPCCGEVITDVQRSRALWGPEFGGTGRFASPLPDAVAARREYLGCAVNRLADPEFSVRECAQGYIDAKRSGGLQTWFNKIMGEVYRTSSTAVTLRLVDQRLQRQQTIILPSGPLGVHYLVGGVDVQAPEVDPTMYLTIGGYAGNGQLLTTALEKIKGWAALFDFARNYKVHRADSEGRAGEYMGLSGIGIDCGAFTGQVLTNARMSVYSVATGARIPILPLRFQAHVKSSAPVVAPAESKRIDPMNREYGVQERYDLHRHTFVDMMMRRWQEGRVAVLCETPNDFPMHITANVLTPVLDVHTWDPTGEEVWERMKGRRDDWAMAMVYMEAFAWIKMDLKRIHELAAPVVPGPAPSEPPRPRGGGWISGQRRGGGWIHGY